MAAMDSAQSQTRFNVLSLARSILGAGLAIGVIGGVEFSIFYYETMGLKPMQLYQFIASALMGPPAFAGGYTTAAIGLLLHFFISFVVAGVYLVAAARLRFLRNILFALLYGTLVNVVMSMGVLPLTALPKMAVTLPLLLNGFIGDAFNIGLPLFVAIWWNTHTVAIGRRPWMEGAASATQRAAQAA